MGSGAMSTLSKTLSISRSFIVVSGRRAVMSVIRYFHVVVLDECNYKA